MPEKQALAIQQGKAPSTTVTIQLTRNVGVRTETAASLGEEPVKGEESGETSRNRRRTEDGKGWL